MTVRGSRRRATLSGLLLSSFVTACTTAGEPPVTQHEEPLPGGYQVVLDTGRSDPGHFQVTREGGLLEITTGPGGTAWRPEDQAEQGDFLAEATMNVVGAPAGYREGYGVFVGGRDLKGKDAHYTYLLVRPSGEFLIKSRRGSDTRVLVDWTRSSAVHTVTNGEPEPTNVVGILTVGDEVRFLVNGRVVHRATANDVGPYGVAGLRINHRLDVRIPSWYLGAPPLGTES